ncbi:hypothetical protein [Novosphingobium sp.]|uniref:hypothetical protein n=1 Tax=Novosphingobium sp. TaxID=1874826 RepID=UPI00262F383D|nr:hypothetical protein [Novosphingobium sp.]
MKVTFGGFYKIDELAEALNRMLADFRAVGVDEIHHVNIYMTLTQGRRRLRLVTEEGEEIEHLQLDDQAHKALAKSIDMKVIRTKKFSTPAPMFTYRPKK